MANYFANDLKNVPGAILQGIFSRNAKGATHFAKVWSASSAYGKLEDFLSDPAIDIVYISSPNHCHAPQTLLALEAGKAVLCEKPFALNVAEAQAMVNMARKRGLFLMEALWTRFLPSFLALEELICQHYLESLTLLRADFGFAAPYNPQSRLFDPAQGGGALYDIGIYPLFLAQHLLGKPVQINTQTHLCPSGVDGTTCITLTHAGGVISQLACSITTPLPNSAHIYGSQGELRLHPMFHGPTDLSFFNNAQQTKFPLPRTRGKGYEYQAIAVMDCLRQGLGECPLWTWEQSLDLVRLMDAIRKSW